MQLCKQQQQPTCPRQSLPLLLLQLLDRHWLDWRTTSCNLNGAKSAWAPDMWCAQHAKAGAARVYLCRASHSTSLHACSARNAVAASVQSAMPLGCQTTGCGSQRQTLAGGRVAAEQCFTTVPCSSHDTLRPCCGSPPHYTTLGRHRQYCNPGQPTCYAATLST